MRTTLFAVVIVAVAIGAAGRHSATASLVAFQTSGTTVAAVIATPKTEIAFRPVTKPGGSDPIGPIAKWGRFFEHLTPFYSFEVISQQGTAASSGPNELFWSSAPIGHYDSDTTDPAILSRVGALTLTKDISGGFCWRLTSGDYFKPFPLPQGKNVLKRITATDGSVKIVTILPACPLEH